ncbi:MAG: TetR/AcrR family transcriptional regulator [Acholeplasmataceae bacterium]|jgi:AcrR family transcriptional regulator
MKDYRLPVRSDGKKTFNKIVKTGVQLFAKFGYYGASINEIIEKSEIATGTFYLYFNDKKALYLYLIDLYGEEIKKAIQKGTRGAQNRYEMEKLGLRSFLIYALKNPISYRIFWEAMYVDDDVFKNYYQDFSRRYIRGLRRGVKDGEIYDDIDLETMSYILMGISNFVGLQVLFNEDADVEYIDRLTDEVMKFLDKGMFKKEQK